MRVALALIFLGLAAFCGFGFLATFESVEGALAWRIGYGAAIVACIVGALRLLRGGTRGHR